MDQIGLFFKCQSCSDYVLTKNIHCPNDHQVCLECYGNLSHCPTCHQRVAPSTRLPYLLTHDVDPNLNVGEAYDILLPSLLRLAPALHPCASDEMIFTSSNEIESDVNIDLVRNNNPTSMMTTSDVNINNTNQSYQDIGQEAARILRAVNDCGYEETISRLMRLANVSQEDFNSLMNSIPSSPSGSHSVHAPPPGLGNATTTGNGTTMLPQSSQPVSLVIADNSNVSQNQQVDGF